MSSRHASAEIRSRYLSGLLGSHQGLILNGVAVDQELADAISSSELLSGQSAQVPILLQGAEVDARLDFNEYSFQHSLALSGQSCASLGPFATVRLRVP